MTSSSTNLEITRYLCLNYYNTPTMSVATTVSIFVPHDYE